MAWLYKQPNSRLWWIGYRVNGKQILRSTGKALRADAEKEMAKLNAIESAQKAGSLTEEFYRLVSGSALTTLSLSSALDKWLEECITTTASGTQQAYRTLAKQFRDYVHATPEKPLLKAIQKDTVFGFLSQMASKRAASTANNRKKVLSTFFLWAMSHHYITSNPAAGIKNFKSSKVDRVERRAFSLDEFRKVLGQCPNEFWRYMVLGEFYTGLRMGDLICLRRKEIKLAENHLKLEAFKVDGKILTIPMASPFREAIQNRLAERGRMRDSDFLWADQAAIYLNEAGRRNNAGHFSSEFYELVLTPLGLVEPRENKKKNEAKSGRSSRRAMNEVSFHSLRHTFISMLKFTGASQSVAKELAGHSSDQVNDLYTHTPIDVLTRAIEQLPV